MVVRGRPVYAPYAAGEWRMAMGLQSLKEAEWLEFDDDHAAQTAEKRRLLAERREEVFQALPESLPAQREVLALLFAHLMAHHADRFVVRGGEVRSVNDAAAYQLADFADAPLDLAGRLVQEDLCVMEAGEGGYRLTAASLCFPARWRLADKLGRPMAAIHEPVPGYGETLARPVDRFFGLVHVDRPVWRVNWSLNDEPVLFQPTGHGRTARNAAVTADNAGERLWVRVERQTLRRLPASGAVLFTIKTYLDPLSLVAADPARADGLRRAVRAMSPAMRVYKSIPPVEAALLAYLERAAATA